MMGTVLIRTLEVCLLFVPGNYEMALWSNPQVTLEPLPSSRGCASGIIRKRGEAGTVPAVVLALRGPILIHN